jgi:hypothetical protein
MLGLNEYLLHNILLYFSRYRFYFLIKEKLSLFFFSYSHLYIIEVYY